jgi:hypothetical protein
MRTRSFLVAVFLALVLAKSVYAQNTYYLPQVATGLFTGGSYRTTFILNNNTDADTTAQLQLTDKLGNPLMVTIAGFGTNNQFSVPLVAGATRMLQTDGTGSMISGSATVTCSIAISVSAIFTVYDASGKYQTEAGVGSSALLTEFVLPIDTMGSSNTGVALFNPGFIDTTVTVIIRGTNGIEVIRTTPPLTLKAGNQLAGFVSGTGQLFPTIGSLRGTMLVQSTFPIAAVALRENMTPLSFTSFPVVPTTSTKTTLNLAEVANGAFPGGAYKTAFLIFNISSTAAIGNLSTTVATTIVDQDTSVNLGTNTSFPFSLDPGASKFLQTDGLGGVAVGAATVTANVPVGAAAVFTILDSQGAFVTEAGVGDSPTMTSMTLPVNVFNGFDTGVAFFNPGGVTANLIYRLMDPSGVLVGASASRSVAPLGQRAEFVSELFPGTSNFYGSVAITANTGVSALIMRQNQAPLSYTTLPIASGGATGKQPISPLLSKTETGITALINDPNVNVNEVLPAGFRLSGTVSGGGQGISVIASAGGNNIFTATVDSVTGKYLMLVPAATYNLTACYQPAGAPATVTVTYADPTAVPVSADTTRDITLPSTAVFNVSGTVSGLSGLPAGTLTTIVFTTSTNTIQGQFTLDAGGNYTGVLPSGTYVAGVGRSPIPISLFQTESLQLYNLGSLIVGGGPASGNYAIPVTATLSGTISGGGLSSIPIGSSVIATDTTAPPVTQLTCCSAPAASSANTNFVGQYQMVLPQNRNLGATATVPIGVGVNLFSTVSYTPIPSPGSLTGDTTFPFVIPKLPFTATIFGTVTDSLGRPVGNAVVTATSQSVQDAANVVFTGITMTNAFGQYSVAVLSGTNYQVTFMPPVPSR